MKTTRRLIQLAFLLLTVAGVFVFRGNAERWCPFGGIEALYAYVTAGNLVCSLGVSNFYILGAVLVMTLLLRRAFCAYMCPIGSVSEWLQVGARRLGLRPLAVPYRLDRALALLKYAVLGVILYFTWSLGELVFRGYDPCYVLISRHGKDITFWAYVISGVVVVVSLPFLPMSQLLCEQVGASPLPTIFDYWPDSRPAFTSREVRGGDSQLVLRPPTGISGQLDCLVHLSCGDPDVQLAAVGKLCEEDGSGADPHLCVPGSDTLYQILPLRMIVVLQSPL